MHRALSAQRESAVYQVAAQLDRINARMQEDISSICIIKACVREGYEKLRFGKADGELIGMRRLRVLVIFAFMNPVVNALMYLMIALILLAGSCRVKSGAATPGTIMAAINYTTQLLSSILMLVMLFQDISRSFVFWKRVKTMLDSRPNPKSGAFDGQASPLGRIEFQDVSFSYPGSGRVVLDHINLVIQSGETVAIMGAISCGKTSMVSLILRFYDMTEGRVPRDGVDVRGYELTALSDKIASTLDLKTEAALYDALNAVGPDCTKLIISSPSALLPFAAWTRLP